MNPIAQARADLAALITAAVGADVPVFTVPPGAIVTPSVVVLAGQGEQVTLTGWDLDLTVRCYGPPGDNTAALEGVEALLCAVAPAVHGGTGQTVRWQQTEQGTVAGNVYLVCEITTNARIGL